MNFFRMLAHPQQFTAFAIALQFLTRLPVPLSGPYDAATQARSIFFYPLVGLVIGVILSLIPLPATTAALNAAIVLAVWVGLTGGLHLDGLAKSIDAWAGGYHNKRKSLEIMQDTAIGPLGVVGLLIVLLLKWAALYQLFVFTAHQLIWVAPVVGRSAMIALLMTTPYIRVNGLGTTLAQHLSVRTVASVLSITTLLLLLWVGSHLIVILSATLITGALLRYLMVARIGGATGDTLGASVEILEMVTLVVLVLFAAQDAG